MMEFQKSTKKGLVLENVAPETIIVEKSNLIDNTRISTNFIINENQESLISKEEINIIVIMKIIILVLI